jgi:nucleotide sugar dehydrogenase
LKITVVALGKIGLPLAVQFARKGHTVIGTDVNELTVKLVNEGVEPFPGEANLGLYLAEVVKNGKLTATTDTTAAVAQSDTVVIVVPLFVDNKGLPDFGWMDAATNAIGAGLKRGTLVSYETTLPVGTTRNRFAPALEKISGLQAGIDFHIVFSPERVSTGRVFADLRKYPKLVGGINKVSAERGIKFYQEVLDFDSRPDLHRENGVWDLESCEASELAKLAETTYRDVNIALANQFAIFSESHGIDVQKVIDASNSQPFSHIHRPGIAVGGHCIPIYPQFYLWNDPAASIVSAARIANTAMPAHVVNTLVRIHGSLDGQRVVVFGAAYRGEVKESAFSGVFPTVEALIGFGAKVFVHDPMYTDDELKELGFSTYHYGEPVDAAILQTDHPEYRELTSMQIPEIRTFLDGRGVTKESNWLGVRYHVIGRAL